MCKNPADQRSERPKQSAHDTITNYKLLYLPGLPKNNLLIVQGSNTSQRLDGHVQDFQRIAPALEDLLDQRADANDLRAGGFGKPRQTQDRLSAGEEVVDDQYLLSIRQVFR